MADKPRYYLTTAIAYPNGAPHVGFAYELIATDAIARFKRLDGYDVYPPAAREALQIAVRCHEERRPEGGLRLSATRPCLRIGLSLTGA